MSPTGKESISSEKQASETGVSISEQLSKKLRLWKKQLLEIQGRIHPWNTVNPPIYEIKYIEEKLAKMDTKLSEIIEEFHHHATEEDIAAEESTIEPFTKSIYKLTINVLKFKKSIEDNSTKSFKLDKLKIPEFSGKFCEWNNFCDLFEAAVVKNSSINEAGKMVYLKSALVGEAKSIVSSFSTSATSFANAWTLVKQRYSNEREIIFAHIRKFDEIRPSQESSSNIRKVIDAVNELTRSMTTLGISVGTWDVLLIYLCLKKLETITKKEWLLSLTSNGAPSLAEFIKFLEKRASALADSNLQKSGSKTQSSIALESTNSKPKASCVLCGEAHQLYQCNRFSSLPVSDRKKLVADNRLCNNCMYKGHGWIKCPMKFSCKICKQRHHHLLHEDTPGKSSVLQLGSSVSQNSSQAQTVVHESGPLSTASQSQISAGHCVPLSPTVPLIALMETALVYVRDASGKNQICRVFLDSGAESNFISEGCVARLGLPRNRTCVELKGIGGVAADPPTGVTTVNLSSRIQPFSCEISTLIIPKITYSNLPREVCESNFPYLKDLPLADPSFASPGPVDILISNRIIGKFKRNGFISGPSGCPDAQNTVFGWVLAGEVNPVPSLSLHTVAVPRNHHECLTSESCLDVAVEKFWKIEEAEPEYSLSQEDEQCELFFKSTVSRNPEGRYIVSLPFKSLPPRLGSSREIVVQRFLNFEKGLVKSPEAYESYKKQMQDQVASCILEEVPVDEIHNPSYYMPHHIVTKMESTSTKHRIVYDASMKTSNGYSLNDQLMTGPKIQIDLVPLLIKFRTHVVAFSADIVKFYNQFLVSYPSTDYQRLIWRKSPSEPLKDFRFVRVTFGVTTAPYLAIRCLHQLAEDYKDEFPLAYPILKSAFLVDNLLSGSKSVGEALEIQRQLLAIMEKAKLVLRKWSSNRAEVLEPIPIEDHELVFPCKVATDELIKTIGLLWNPNSDIFSIKVPAVAPISSVTKRQVLSSIAKVFDPLGWISPITVRAKSILQELWKEKLTWDCPIPQEHLDNWNRYLNDLSLIKSFELNRCLTRPSANCDSPTYEIYGFSDASQTAYSACVYLKTSGNPGQVTSELIIGKTKVAPVKKETTPRLELCGAVLLTKVVKVVEESLNLPISSVNLFTDSTIVLDWIASTKQLGIFEQNRVNKIHATSSHASWNHVDGEENPADMASRGISASKFLNNKFWLEGPEWIKTREVVSTMICTVKAEESSFFQNSVSDFISSSSSYIFISRVMAYWIRFLDNVHLSNRTVGPLTVSEVQRAVLVIVKVVQKQMFAKEIEMCKNKKVHLSCIKSLYPFLDKDGVLRVGGRLRNSFFSYDQRHPILLPKAHHFTKLVARYFHEKHHHPGPQLLLSLIREKFWIPRGPQLCSSIVKACVKCHKANPQPLSQIMGQLPSHRVQPSRPFSNVGVDYAGPFFLNLVKGRKPKTTKSYVSVFVCLVTKAVHLELVGDLTTESYIAALKRFTSRRGLPAKVVCDGGRNFLGAKNEALEITRFLASPQFQTQINKYFVDNEIVYEFNPPLSPHHGGIFEAAVKSMKQHLHRVVGDRRLMHEEFGTILCEIEAILNSRPITPVSQDPNDFGVLTPGHFLIGGPMKAVPQANLEDVKLSTLSRWQLTQQITQHFFKRWSTQYLQSLQKSSKWYSEHPNLAVGTMVLLNDSDSTMGPQQWKLGRIKTVYPGLDNLVRVVDVSVPVTTDKGVRVVTYKRPITKISPLTFDE